MVNIYQQIVGSPAAREADSSNRLKLFPPPVFTDVLFRMVSGETSLNWLKSRYLQSLEGFGSGGIHTEKVRDHEVGTQGKPIHQIDRLTKDRKYKKKSA